MPYQTKIRDALYDRLRPDYQVIEIDGWQTRGSAYFSPKGFVDHHTAGSSRGDMPSLNILINGRSGLPGPLCNVGKSRSQKVYLVAAGRANHAGKGGWKGLRYNSSVWGLESENVGTTHEPWSAEDHHVCGLIAAACLSVSGSDASLHCQHKEWAPTRKIDRHSVNGAAMRKIVADLLSGGEGFLMALSDKEQKELLSKVRALADGVPSFGIGPTHVNVQHIVWQLMKSGYGVEATDQPTHREMLVEARNKAREASTFSKQAAAKDGGSGSDIDIDELVQRLKSELPAEIIAALKQKL